jgi:hypothetical protein
MDLPHTKFRHGYALIRADFPFDEMHPENCVSVLKIFPNKEAAHEEQQRLSVLNAGKNCVYFVQTTRLVEQV